MCTTQLRNIVTDSWLFLNQVDSYFDSTCAYMTDRPVAIRTRLHSICCVVYGLTLELYDNRLLNVFGVFVNQHILVLPRSFVSIINRIYVVGCFHRDKNLRRTFTYIICLDHRR